MKIIIISFSYLELPGFCYPLKWNMRNCNMLHSVWFRMKTVLHVEQRFYYQWHIIEHVKLWKPLNFAGNASCIEAVHISSQTVNQIMAYVQASAYERSMLIKYVVFTNEPQQRVETLTIPVKF